MVAGRALHIEQRPPTRYALHSDCDTGSQLKRLNFVCRETPTKHPLPWEESDYSDDQRCEHGTGPRQIQKDLPSQQRVLVHDTMTLMTQLLKSS